MTGFIGRLFSSKDKADRNETKAEAPAPARKEQPAAAPTAKDAFFLDTDSASGMGDVEYMRTVKKVKRTYARTVDSPQHMEQVKEISAMNGKISAGSNTSSNGSTPSSEAQPNQQSAPQVNEAQQRRKSDTSMDMFRNMAKDIRK
ncbi:hypothetical protein C7B65_10990 [Phormidesmis priestleyi ULC007]|uniref:Uncharacterized protein n=1 Tax=Phormidesmis priestleyi ULC007 TaxID=1920490 RepID=A0A2T1DG28_9CYAN|nr:hypothetical protein [Phormidesmis priestleyi]PSB19438.1 hypothetical protein C7B65_10990 [Phormidesmis priestleyi ULC007]PZO53121.1 MAG: hypothetical protein DCF14_05760 [Phormidesmis priestleyi]